jgi:hypothetical protein
MFSHLTMVPSGITSKYSNLSPPSLEPPSSLGPAYELIPPASTLAPTMSQLASLTHLPSGMVSMLQARSLTSKQRKRGPRSRSQLVRDAQIVSKLFNEVASRPYPVNRMSLEQQIDIEVSFVSLAFLATSLTVPQYAAAYFTLANFSASAQLTAVFDQYRFRQIEVWLEPTNAQGSTVFGPLTTSVDLDDANVPTSFGIVSDKPGAITSQGGAGHYHKWMPHVAVAVYSGAFTSFSNEPALWLDCASTGIQHYGLKAATTATPASVTYNLTVRAIIQFRAPAIS